MTDGSRKDDIWKTSLLPDRMDGKDVLDVGAYDGGLSFEAERRGARTITAIDVWGVRATYWFGTFESPSKESFDYCHRLLNSKVISRVQSIYDLHDERAYDWVFFSQVLYHLENPMLGLRNVSRASRDKVMLNTRCDCISTDCSMRYTSHDAICNDMTNFWCPTLPCLIQLCSDVGMSVNEQFIGPNKDWVVLILSVVS